MKIILFSIIIVLIAIFNYYKPILKGFYGESKISRKLRSLKPDKYKVLNNILLKTSWGSSQIDHLVISTFGIFVIETKYYKGWIFGHENSEYWTQILFKKKTNFKNPIKQNWVHVNALKEILSNYPFIKYHPIIVFAGYAELKSIESEVPVMYANSLVRYIKKTNKTEYLSIDEVNKIFYFLNALNIKDRKLKKAHKQAAKKYSNDNRKKEKSSTCPKCGGKLIVKNGKYGQFYGCLNFPECRHTQKYN